jgi:hypothetical protein
MSFITEHPLEARYYMGQIISEDLSFRSSQELLRAKSNYRFSIHKLLRSKQPNELIPAVHQLAIPHYHKSTLEQLLSQTITKITLDPNQDSQNTIDFSKLNYPNCDTSPVRFPNAQIFPAIEKGRLLAIQTFLNTLSTNNHPLFLFTEEQIKRYFLSPDSTPQITKSTPFPTRLPN